jgi:hypothetical protein
VCQLPSFRNRVCIINQVASWLLHGHLCFIIVQLAVECDLTIEYVIMIVSGSSTNWINNEPYGSMFKYSIFVHTIGVLPPF